jgi:hypothetical protein
VLVDVEFAAPADRGRAGRACAGKNGAGRRAPVRRVNDKPFDLTEIPSVRHTRLSILAQADADCGLAFFPATTSTFVGRSRVRNSPNALGLFCASGEIFRDRRTRTREKTPQKQNSGSEARREPRAQNPKPKPDKSCEMRTRADVSDQRPQRGTSAAPRQRVYLSVYGFSLFPLRRSSGTRIVPRACVQSNTMAARVHSNAEASYSGASLHTRRARATPRARPFPHVTLCVHLPEDTQRPRASRWKRTASPCSEPPLIPFHVPTVHVDTQATAGTSDASYALDARVKGVAPCWCTHRYARRRLLLLTRVRNSIEPSSSVVFLSPRARAPSDAAASLVSSLERDSRVDPPPRT